MQDVIRTISKQYRLFIYDSQTFQNAYLQSLELRSDEVQQYEDDRLQYYGRRMIPIRKLMENAMQSMRTVQKQQLNDKHVKDPSFDDWLLVELTKWFNEIFFEWVNSLPCKVCGKETSQSKGSLVDGGVRVEVRIYLYIQLLKLLSNEYFNLKLHLKIDFAQVLYCCNTQTKFYRYNDVAQLLLTRKGRCGEYANCFTFLCRCLGYEARLVQATFDHVWTEVISISTFFENRFS